MVTLIQKARISFLPLLLAAVMVLLAIGILFAQAQMSDSGGGSGISADLSSHQDGDGPPKCRPASQYGGNPRPSDPACKHKPNKHQ